MLVALLTIILVLSTAMVSWTWVQAILNYRAVRGERELERYTLNIVLRETAFLVCVGALAVIGILSLPSPRPIWARLVISWLSIALALGLAGVSFHDYQDMKEQLDPSDEGR